jgi:hypothetical protein
MNALLQTKLENLSDTFADIKRIVPDDDDEGYSRNPKVLAGNVIAAIEELRTRLAVGELVDVAYRFHGGKGSTDATILRRKAA